MKKEMNKNDRRYAFTHNTIKDAMLELLHSADFNQITVSSLCRQAPIPSTRQWAGKKTKNGCAYSRSS